MTLCRFVAYLHCTARRYQTICSYLSAVRHLQIANSFPDSSLSPFHRIDYVLRGIHRDSSSPPTWKHLPVTQPIILRSIHQLWSRELITHDRVIYGPYSVLVSLDSSGQVNSHDTPWTGLPHTCCHLETSASTHVNPHYMAVHLKTDPFGFGTTLLMGHTGSSLCPVTAMLA